jgi:hypothetical protein
VDRCGEEGDGGLDEPRYRSVFGNRAGNSCKNTQYSRFLIHLAGAKLQALACKADLSYACRYFAIRTNV